MMLRSWGQLVLLFGVMMGLVGCQDNQLDYLEVKRVHELLTEQEIKTYLRIIDNLPEEKMPEFPPAYPPPVQWDEKRSLTVLDLVEAEERNISNHWNEDTLSRQLDKNRELKKQLRRARMTTRQFIGFTRAIGCATGRLAVKDTRDMTRKLEQGDAVVRRLKTNAETPFSKLEPEERHVVLQEAMWLTRVYRIKMMQQVPPENVELVKKYKEELLDVFPEDFTENPIDAVRDMLVDYGLPFEEIKPDGSDVELTWELSEARVGPDQPDEFLKNPGALSRRRLPTYQK